MFSPLFIPQWFIIQIRKKNYYSFNSSFLTFSPLNCLTNSTIQHIYIFYIQGERLFALATMEQAVSKEVFLLQNLPCRLEEMGRKNVLWMELSRPCCRFYEGGEKKRERERDYVLDLLVEDIRVMPVFFSFVSIPKIIWMCIFSSIIDQQGELVRLHVAQCMVAETGTSCWKINLK